MNSRIWFKPGNSNFHFKDCQMISVLLYQVTVFFNKMDMKSPFTYYLQLNTEHMTSHMTYMNMNMWYEIFVELSDETIREIHSKFIK